MTPDPFDELERQLRSRVLEARTTPRRSWRSHRVVAALLLVGLGGSGVAVAAGGLRGPGDRERGREVAWSVIADTKRQPACVAPRSVTGGHVVFTDAVVPPPVLAALPWMAEPASAAEQRRALRLTDATHPTGGTVVLRSTVRVVRLDSRWEILTRLERGQGGFQVRDPAACQALRRERLETRVASEGPGVQRWARRTLALDVSANPDAMTLWFMLVSHGRPSMGSGSTVLPGAGRGEGHEVPSGLKLIGGARAGGRRIYVGLASPGTARMGVRVRPGVRGLLPRAVAVHRGFWRLELPRHTGPIRVTELNSDGQPGAVVRLRS